MMYSASYLLALNGPSQALQIVYVPEECHCYSCLVELLVLMGMVSSKTLE